MSRIGAARHGIPARYGGVCVTCGAGYRSGDQITRHPHGWGHARCPEEQPARPVCPSCHMETAANGLCECEGGEG